LGLLQQSLSGQRISQVDKDSTAESGNISFSDLLESHA